MSQYFHVKILLGVRFRIWPPVRSQVFAVTIIAAHTCLRTRLWGVGYPLRGGKEDSMSGNRDTELTGGKVLPHGPGNLIKAPSV